MQRANELLKNSEFNGFYQVVVAETAAAAARDWTGLLAISESRLPREGPLFFIFSQLEGVLALRHLNRTEDASALLDSAEIGLQALVDNPPAFESRMFAMAKSFYVALRGDTEATNIWVLETKQRRENEDKGDISNKVSSHLQYARCLALADLHSEAIEELRNSLESTGGDRFPLIDVLPAFDVLKEHPDYIALRQRFADSD